LVEPHRSAFSRALDALHLVALSFFVAAALAGVARGAEGAGTAAIFYLAILVATAALAARVHGDGGTPALRNLHLGWTIVMLPAAFTGLRWIAPAAAPPERRFDDALYAIDRDWFGVDIAKWSEGFLTAPIADLAMVFYALYFLMPIVALAALGRRGDRAATYRAAFPVAFGVYACYMLYMLVPAAGPRHAYVGRSEPLPRGLLTGWLHDFIRDLEPQAFDAFPSAHVVLGLLCAVVLWPMGGWIRWSMAIVGVGTAISTVVLRYHYLVDDLASLLVIAAALAARALLDSRIARKAAADPHGDRMGELLGG